MRLLPFFDHVDQAHGNSGLVPSYDLLYDAEKTFQEAVEKAVKEGQKATYQAAKTPCGSASLNVLRAGFVTKVVKDCSWVSSPGLHITGAKIITGAKSTECLSFTSMLLLSLVLDHCEFDTLKLDDSHAPSIELRECTAQAISAKGLVVDGSFTLKKLNLRGRGAESMTGTNGNTGQVKAADPTLDCYRLKAEDVNLNAVTIKGETNFAEAKIENLFTCSGYLSNPCRSALTCDGMRVKGNMYIGDRQGRSRSAVKSPDSVESCVRVEGGVQLIGAHIEGEVNLTAVQIRNEGYTALDAKRLKVGTDLYLDSGFMAVGLVQLVGATVDRQVNCTGGRFFNGSKAAINADGLVTGDFYLDSLDSGEEQGGRTSKFIAVGGIRLVGATVRGRLRCSGAEITSEGESIRADNIEAGEIYLNNKFQARGKVQLVGARIQNRADFSGGEFIAGADSVAIMADGATAATLRFAEELRATGKVSLVGVKATAELNCTSGQFRNPQGYALKADRSTCGNVYLNKDFVAEGCVSFWGATLAYVDCSGGRFLAEQARPEEPKIKEYGTFALDFAQTLVEDIFYAPDMHVEGGLSLAGARIKGDLDLTGASITPTTSEPRGRVLSGPGLTVDGRLSWRRLAKPPAGKVDLSYAKVGLLWDDLASWPGPHGGRRARQEPSDLNLDGFQYGGIEVKREVASLRDQLPNRLNWLSSATPFSAQPFEELAKVYREDGQEDSAQKVVIREERERRWHGGLPALSRGWNLFLDWTVGYGYKAHRIVGMFVVLAVAGALLFHQAQHKGIEKEANGNLKRGSIMEAVAWRPPTKLDECSKKEYPDNKNQLPCIITAEKCTPYYPCFSPVAYSVQLLIPLINFRVLEYWLPDMGAPWGIWYLVYTWTTILLGWLGVTALIGGLGRIWQRK